MINLDDRYLTPEQKLNKIFDRFRAMCSACDQLSLTDSAKKGLELSTTLTDVYNFLMLFAGDQDLIDYANKLAITNPFYPERYDVQVDFAKITSDILSTKAQLAAIDYSSATSINEDGRQAWVNIDYTATKAAISELLSNFQR